MRDSIVFYRSFYEAIKEIPMEQQGVIYNAIYGYALDGIVPELTGVAKSIFLLVKPQIDANNERYENGCRGGAPKGNQNAKKQPKNNQKTTEKQPVVDLEEQKKQPNDNVNENVNDNENDLKENVKRKSTTQAKAFVKPTTEEVKAYCGERKNNVNAEKFVDFYESKGWLIGKNPMKDWKACVRTWEKGSTSPPNKPTNAYVDTNSEQYKDLEGYYIT